mmetsp:Transcript_78186/g.242414  ORF Transcript_78186/g.242414 Transcript_78186/m.242414 type:complete len:216 (+) Transcript_78186:941-1588(+)
MQMKDTYRPSLAWNWIISLMPWEPRSCMSVRNSRRRCRGSPSSAAPLQMPTAASMPADSVVPPPAASPATLACSAVRSRSRTGCKGCTTVPSELKVARPKRSSSRSWATSPSKACLASCSLLWPSLLLPESFTPDDMEPDTSRTATMSAGVASRGWPSRQDLRKHPTHTSSAPASASTSASAASTERAADGGTRPARTATATVALCSGSPAWKVC